MSGFRTTILVQSALGGAVMGLIAGAVLFAAGLGIGLVLPDAASRVVARGRTAGVLLCFVLLPMLGALLGWLEGRLKL